MFGISWLGDTDAGGRFQLDCSIQRLSPQDLEGLSLLIGQSMADPWTTSQLEDALREGVCRASWAFFAPSPPVGFVVARRIADLLEIDLVGVEPGHRRRGIAAFLLKDLLSAEEEAGMAEARLELAASNEPARALYERLGFVVVGRRARYYPDGADALLLSRRAP